MRLRLAAADRLVELVEERCGSVAADEAARRVLKLGGAVPVGLARSLLGEAVAAEARLRWPGDLVALAGPPGEALLLERTTFVVFDLETMRLTGGRVAATVIDTVGLARRLLGRQPANLDAFAYRFATDAQPCHCALPDAEATAEILVRLIGLAQERGARTVADLVELAPTLRRGSPEMRVLPVEPQTA